MTTAAASCDPFAYPLLRRHSTLAADSTDRAPGTHWLGMLGPVALEFVVIIGKLGVSTLELVTLGLEIFKYMLWVIADY